MKSVVEQIRDGIPGVEPWVDDREVVKATLMERGGEWAVAAAYLDYANLTAVSAPIQRSAFKRLSGKKQEQSLRLHSQRISKNEELLAEVDAEAQAIAALVPRSQIEATIIATDDFLTATAGHLAVATFRDTLTQLSPS